MIVIALYLLAAVCVMGAALLVARRIVRKKRQDWGEAGIQTAAFVTLGGIQQYIQIRGRDRRNPLLLVLHGGPGNPLGGVSYAWQGMLEQAYTVVHWDQRGCGNTWYRNRNAARPALEILLADLDELVDRLCSQFDQKQVILMGHSWGTFLGSHYAARHPEKIIAFLSVSQMLDLRQSEEAATREAVRLAAGAGRKGDAARMETLLEQVMALRTMGPDEARVLLTLRQVRERYLPPQYGTSLVWLRLLSPDVTWAEWRWMFQFQKLIDANRSLYEELLSPQAPSLPEYYEVPVIIVMGERDWTTPVPLAEAYCHRITAPEKRLITIGGAGHLPFLEQPEGFSAAVEKALQELKTS